MSSLIQILAITSMNLRNVPSRLGTSLVIIFGMASVVGVLVSVLSMSTGFMEMIARTGRADRAIVTSHGVLFEAASMLDRNMIPVIMDAPGVKSDAEGKAIGSPSVFDSVPENKKSNGVEAPVSIRGVNMQAASLFPEIKLISGRMFKPAVRELIVGRMVQSQYAGLDVGSKIDVSGNDWTIVGSFESNGDQHESELLADADTLLSALRRGSFHAATVMLTSPDTFSAFKDSVTANPQLTVDVTRETDFLAAQAKPVNDVLILVAYAVGGVMALGAVFGALNTMYSAVAARSVEIATLRAMGFNGEAVIISVLVEAMALTLVGAALGFALAWMFFHDNVVTFPGLIFILSFSPHLMLLALTWALGVGLLGGLLPAIRATRLPVATVLNSAR